VVAGVLVFQSLYLVWLVFRPGGESVAPWISDGSVTLAALTAAVVSFTVAASHRGSQTGIAWLLIATGMLLFGLGELAWSVQEAALGMEVPQPSVADIGYLGGYPPIFLGLLLMPHAPGRAAPRARLALDVLIGISAAAVISWNFVIAPLITDYGAWSLGDIVALTYPFADLGILLAVLILVARARMGAPLAHLMVLAGAFAVTALADSFYVYLQNAGAYGGGHYIDIGWVAGYNLVTLSAVLAVSSRSRPSLRQLDEEQPGSLLQACVLYAAVVPLGALMLIERQTVLTAGSLVVILLMFGRQLIAIQENASLNRRLARLTEELEMRVKAQAMDLLRQRGSGETAGAAGTDLPAREAAGRFGR
jgi:hypothetical protein